MDIHYTAVIAIHKSVAEERDQYDKIKTHKNKADVAHLVVRHETLEGLEEKINKAVSAAL